ncbi:non-specific serine/threonine kinase domain protein [Mycobacterium xenopi 3993]|nr:non-specific serine/threonine kinase domain protein [Mycobacterium xenopi 3993]
MGVSVVVHDCGMRGHWHPARRRRPPAARHQRGRQPDVLHFVDGYWQAVPKQERVQCRPPGATAVSTQTEVVVLSLAAQPDGALRGMQTETVRSNECDAQGAVLRIPWSRPGSAMCRRR